MPEYIACPEVNGKINRSRVHAMGHYFFCRNFKKSQFQFHDLFGLQTLGSYCSPPRRVAPLLSYKVFCYMLIPKYILFFFLTTEL